MHLKLKFCATLTVSLLLLSGTIFAQKDFFTELRKSYSVATFLSTAKYLNDYNTSLEKTLSALKKEKMDFRKSDADSVRVGALCYYVKNKGIYTHYSTKDGSCWFDIFNHPSADSIKHYAEYLNSKRQAFSNIGSNFSAVNTFLTADSKTKSAVGASINGGKIIFNFGFDLPFPVKYFDSLSTSHKKTVFEKAGKLFKVLKIITDNFIDPSEMIYYPGIDKKLTANERLYGLIQFWTEAKYNFAFFDKIPDMDWDKTLLQYIPVIQKEQTISEYYKNMIKLCALLKDGHTNIYPPNDYYADIDKPMLRLKNVQNKAVIVNEGVSLGNSIPIGSVIIKVNGSTTEEFLHKEIFPFLSSSTEYILYDWGIRDMLDGKKGSSVTITIKTPDGKEKEVKIVRKSGNEKWLVEQNGGSWNLVDFKRLSDGIVYTNIKTFGTEKVNEEFDKLVDSIKTAKGLIIDLRNNGGGNSGTGYGIINHLTDKPYVTSKWKTREHKPAYKAWGSYFAGLDKSAIDKMGPADKQQAIESINTLNGNSWFEGKPDTITPPKGEKINIPVVVLTGHNTASAAEDFLIAMDGLKRAKVVGERTFGSTGQPMVLKLPGGGSARICTKRDTYPDGREFVGYGVAPDVFVEQTVEDYLANKDVVLEKGIEVLKKSITK